MIDNPLNKFDPDSPEAQVCRSQPLGVHTLHASPTNPRKTFDAKAMAELVASVREHGILQPIVVRFWPVGVAYTGPDLPMYEVVCGERRYRAAREAGLHLIPGIVRDLDDKSVIELQLLENLQREGLHELEEAEGYEVMMKQYGYTADALADKIGKSRSYVFGRTKLLQLDDEARRLFRGGVLNASTALLVARIPTAKLRAKAIKEITEKDYNGDTPSVREAQRILQQRFMLRLATASFPTDDATLVGGTCAACQKRTGNQPADLFDDVDSPDVCTDPDCFAIKVQAHKDRLASEAKDAGKEVITGEAAKKITGGYVSEHSSDVGKGYVRLDATCYADPGHRTYREIVGDAIQETLIEDTHHNRLVPVVKNTVIADKLKEAGIDTGDEKREKEEKKKQAQVETERAFRSRVIEQIRSEAGFMTIDGETKLPPETQLGILREIIVEMWLRSYDHTKNAFMLTWKIEGKNITERKEATPGFVRQAEIGWCWPMLIDLLIGGAASVDSWSIDHPHQGLETMAKLFGINTAEVRKTLIAEQKSNKSNGKASGKAKKTAEKVEKTPVLAAAEGSTPCKAARAAEVVGAENVFKVGDRVRVTNPDDIEGTAKGWREKVLNAEGVVLATADDHWVTVRLDGPSQTEEDFTVSELTKIETNETPTGTEPAEAETTTGESGTEGAEIEINATPKAKPRARRAA